MASRMRFLLSAGIFVELTVVSLAHDLASGPRMGLPPKSNTIDLSELLPSDLAADEDLRGVIDKARKWPQHQELIICFLSGTTKARTRVANTSLEWTKYVNLRFDFGSLDNPRGCGGGKSEHIKIDFLVTGADAGHWSYVGIESLDHARSMNLEAFGGDDLPSGVEQKEFRRIVLHEFGHAIGFEHEHQSPTAGCAAEFKPAKVTAWAKKMGWSAADVETNLAEFEPKASLTYSRYDPKSIMHYSLPEELLEGGRKHRCWIEPNYELSEGDKNFAQQTYPMAVASLPDIDNESVRGSPRASKGLGSAPKKIRQSDTDYRISLEKEYSEVLRKRGLSETRIDGLTKVFRELLKKLRSGLSQ